MSWGSFVRIALPFWSGEFLIALLYSHFGPEEITVVGILVVLVSTIVLPFMIGARLAAADGSIKQAMFGASLVSVASLLAVAITYIGKNENGFMLFGYLSVIAIVFVAPQAAFGYVGAFLVKYSKAVSTKQDAEPD